MEYIYMAIAFVWIVGLGFNAAYIIPTATVSLIYLEILFKCKFALILTG